MSLHTYPFKIGGKEVNIQAKKEEAERAANALLKPLKLNQFYKELNGVIGEKEDSSIYYTPFSQHAVPDAESWKKECQEFIDSLPDAFTLTLDSAVPFIRKAHEIFIKYMPVEDHRQTKEQVLVRQAECVVAQHQRDLADQEWRSQWCKPEAVKVPKDMMTIELSITFNNSDSMTDYFDHHARIGERMLLAIVSKQHETERIARRVMSCYPELMKRTWIWHTEKYSMGHGNYLQSDYFAKVKHHAYDGREEVDISFEIEFNTCTRDNAEMWAYKDYPGIQGPAAPPPQELGQVIIRRNEAHQGIEVIFPERPEASIIGFLKDTGFRWSRHQNLWYAKYTDDRMKTVENKLKSQPPTP